MSDVTVFSYLGVDVRVALLDGQPQWVAADIARALEYRTAHDMTRSIDEEEKGYADVRTPGGVQSQIVVSEAGVYQAIFGSRSKGAKQFRRWVTGVVLPEIRQTGVYSLIPTKPAEPELPTDFLSALKALVTEVEQTTELRAELAEATPRAEAWDAIVSAKGDYSVGDAAKMLARAGIQTSPHRLFAQLSDIRWTFRGGDNAWRAYSDRVTKGYLSEKPSFHYHPGTGERVVDPPQVRVTVKGLERLRLRLHSGALSAVTA